MNHYGFLFRLCVSRQRIFPCCKEIEFESEWKWNKFAVKSVYNVGRAYGNFFHGNKVLGQAKNLIQPPSP